MPAKRWLKKVTRYPSAQSRDSIRCLQTRSAAGFCHSVNGPQVSIRVTHGFTGVYAGGGAGGAGAPPACCWKKNLRGVWLSQYEKNPIQLNYWLRSVADSNTWCNWWTCISQISPNRWIGLITSATERLMRMRVEKSATERTHCISCITTVGALL
jgi:hypothetical protein